MISFVVPIKNRTKFEVEYAGKKIILELFKNSLDSLMGLRRYGDLWEFVVVDFKSDDVDMPSFLEGAINAPGCSYKHVSVEGPFSRGRGLNIGFSHCSHEVLFFLDADMMMRTRSVLEDVHVYVEEQDCALFPICHSYRNPEHSSGWIRHTGFGNAAYKKSDFVRYQENKRWGGEDVANYNEIRKSKKVIRKYYGEEFIHQWHPDNGAFKNRFCRD